MRSVLTQDSYSHALLQQDMLLTGLSGFLQYNSMRFASCLVVYANLMLCGKLLPAGGCKMLWCFACFASALAVGVSLCAADSLRLTFHS